VQQLRRLRSKGLNRFEEPEAISRY